MNLYNPTTIPYELKYVPRWVSWRADRRNGRTDKLPLDKNNLNRKINSLTNCESWEEINRRIFNIPGELGLGFYPDSENTRLVGIDLDHVFDENGAIKPKANDIVHALDSYTEYSPSHTGLHVWIYSAFSPRNHNGSVCEIKSRGNSYLTVTGWVYNKPKTIKDRTAILREILSEYFPEPKTTEEKQETIREKRERLFLRDDDTNTLRKLWADPGRRALWNGDTSAYDNDPSRADLALCNYIFLCSDRDPSAIDRLFRRSGLMRKKWDEVHYADGSTYGEMTIRKVFAGRC